MGAGFSAHAEACARSGCPASCARTQQQATRDAREALTPLSEAGPIRLAVASVEIGRVLAARGKLRFVASGTCMYPNVRPGDVLAVEPRAAGKVAVGDVLVFRRGASLFGHRAVEVGRRDGRTFVITQPDRSSGPDNEAVWEEDVIGIAPAAERRGRRVSLERSRARPGAVRGALLAAKLRAIEGEPRLRTAAIAALERLQAQPVYGNVARRVVAGRLAGLAYRVRLPLADGRSRTLFRELPVEEAVNGGLAVLAARPDGAHWTLAATLPPGDRPIGLVTYAARPPECPFPGWSRERGFVRTRYRGLGLEGDLLAQASRVLAALQAQPGPSTTGEQVA